MVGNEPDPLVATMLEWGCTCDLMYGFVCDHQVPKDVIKIAEQRALKKALSLVQQADGKAQMEEWIKREIERRQA